MTYWEKTVTIDDTNGGYWHSCGCPDCNLIREKEKFDSINFRILRRGLLVNLNSSDFNPSFLK